MSVSENFQSFGKKKSISPDKKLIDTDQNSEKNQDFIYGLPKTNAKQNERMIQT